MNIRKYVTAKSSKRERIVDQITEILKSPIIFKTINYRQRSESYIKQYMHQPLLNQLTEMHKELYPHIKNEELWKEKARMALMWEGDVNTTINNFLFLGVQHRPDFEVHMEKLRIAIEIKRGESGAAVREGLGQCLVYASEYDFVIYTFVDISKDKKILRSIEADLPEFEKEKSLIESLWENYNIRFSII